MRKIRILTLVLGVVVAFSAVIVSAASAETNMEWLINGAAITSAQPSRSVGELLLEDMSSAAGKTDVLCSVVFVGTVGPGGAGTITEVLNLAETSSDIECAKTSSEICEGTELLVEAKKLPWSTEIMLTAGGVYYDLITGVEYWVFCKVPLIGTLEDKCSGVSGAELTNVTGGVEGKFLESNEEITPAESCSVGGEKEGLMIGNDTTKPTAGGTTTVSESTSAETSMEWLINGAAITSAQPSKSVGELLAEDMGSAAGKTDVLCSFTFIGTVGPGGADTITEVLNLAETSSDIECAKTSSEICEGTELLVEAKKLPWSTEIMLTAGGVYYDLITSGEYAIFCKVPLIGTIENKCSGTSGTEMTNVTGGVEGKFLESNEEITPAGNCSVGGEKEWLLIGSFVVSSSAGTLTVSE